MVAHMFADFLPSEVAQLTEPSAIALMQGLRRTPIPTSLSSQPIPTTYIQSGSVGTPILLLHGFDSSVLEFRRLFPLLADQQATWIVDLLGFGFTERSIDIPISPLTIKTHLYEVWKTLINQPVILVGASMGGAVAIDFTATYPEAVHKLVLIDSAGLINGPAIGKYLVPPLGYLATEFLRLPWVRQQTSLNAYADRSYVTADALLCAALHLKQANWNQAMISFTRSGGYTVLTEQISLIHQPTLILWGDSDKILGTADAKKFEAAIAQSQLIWIKNCGHVPHLEQPAITAQHILAFGS